MKRVTTNMDCPPGTSTLPDNPECNGIVEMIRMLQVQGQDNAPMRAVVQRMVEQSDDPVLKAYIEESGFKL